MYVEMESDDPEMVEHVVQSQLQEGKHVRLTVRNVAGRYSILASSVEDEPGVTSTAPATS
jgi:hypothetical protein